MLTNFLHALVQSWDSASGQMAPIPPTVWLGEGGCGVRVCAHAIVCVSDSVSACERDRQKEKASACVCMDNCRSSFDVLE